MSNQEVSALKAELTRRARQRDEFKGEVNFLVKEMKNLLIETKPVEVALTLAPTNEEFDILPEALVNELISNSKLEVKPKLHQYTARNWLALDLCWEFATTQGWLDASSYRSKQNFIVLRRTPDNLEYSASYDIALEWAQEFEIDASNIKAAQYMWDEVALKRVSPEYILSIFGDDRDNNYFLILQYSHYLVDYCWETHS